jgi:hypothetical protein
LDAGSGLGVARMRQDVDYRTGNAKKRRRAATFVV